jgi:hypothetical protein
VADESSIAAMRVEEIRLEQQLSMVVPRVFDLVQKARSDGATVAFLSDMYLGTDIIVALLRIHGMFQDGDLVLISSDTGMTKANGGLYDILRKTVGNEATIVHHGDNIYSDIQIARTRGIATVHIADATLNRYECILDSYRWDTGGLGSVLSGASRVARLTVKTSSTREVVLRDITAGVAAPLLVGFTLWLFEQARQHGIRRLYFTSRDGQVLLRIATILQPRLSTDFELRYLYGGRQAWHLAASAELEIKDVNSMLLSNFGGSFRMLLRRLDLDDDNMRRFTRTVIPEARWDELLGAYASEVSEKLLSIDAVLEEFRTRGRNRAALLGDYLEQQGFLDRTASALVDIGWTGRSAASLACVLRSLGVDPPRNLYLGLYDTPPPASKYASYLGLLQESAPSLDVDAFVGICEAFCSGDHGSVLGFKNVAGSITPILASDVNLPVADWGLPIVRETINTFCREVYIDPDRVPINADLRPPSIAVLDELILRPTLAEATEFGAYPFEDEQAGGGHMPLASPLSFRDILKYSFRRMLPARRWPSASVLLSSRSVRVLVFSQRNFRRCIGSIKSFSDARSDIRRGK